MPIPGSILLTATKPDPDAFYTMAVVAVSGTAAMTVQYANDVAPQGVPDNLATSALHQRRDRSGADRYGDRSGSSSGGGRCPIGR
jgi:hypothetical protein